MLSQNDNLKSLKFEVKSHTTNLIMGSDAKDWDWNLKPWIPTKIKLPVM